MSRLRNDWPDLTQLAAQNLWLTEEVDQEGKPLVHPEVREVARRNWSWSVALVSRQLTDAPHAATICEELAIDVSQRLQQDPQVGRDLDSYFRTAMINRVRTEAARARRIVYLGATYNLEVLFQPATAEGMIPFENKMILASIAACMTHEVRVILHYLLARYTWREIAARLQLSEKQAQSRFYYGVRRAYERLLDQQARRSREEGGPNP